MSIEYYRKKFNQKLKSQDVRDKRAPKSQKLELQTTQLELSFKSSDT